MKKPLEKEKINICYQEHLSGKSIADLAKENDVSWHVMYNYFKRRDLKTTKGLHRSLKYRNIHNEDYFSIINTHEQAYLLGFLYADGYIRKKDNRIGLGLKPSDIKIVEYLKNAVKTENKITIEANKVTIEFASGKIVNDLLKLGVKRNKTYKEMHLPIIDNCFMNSFILGYLDGDGWISISTKRIQIGICSLSKEMLLEIQNYLISFDIKTSIYCDKRSLKNENHKDLFSIIINNNKSKLLFLQHIYKNSTIFLDRKYQKMLQANTVLTSKITKGLEVV